MRKQAMVMVCMASLWGCAEMNKEQIGTGLGALAGGAIGYAVDKEKGAAIGAALGGVVGNRIGASLDERDKQALMAQSAQALSMGADGTASQWHSDRTGASATLTPKQTRIEEQPVTIVRDKRVVVADNLKLVNKTYATNQSSKVRIGPGTSYEQIGGMKAGEIFTAVGITSDGWLLIGKKGVSVGYIRSDLASESSSQANSKTASMRDKGVDLDSVAASSSKAVDLDGVNIDNMQVVAEKVNAKTTCRTVDVNVKDSKGQKSSDSVKACQAADGAWEV